MKKQLNSLQLYRGLASILVVLHHANIILDRELQRDGSFGIFHFGWIGVDFFFVLSGFIIFYIHRSDIGQPSQFKSFITKRFLRIYPLYWIVLFCKVVGSWRGDQNGIQSNLIQLIQAIFLVPQPKANLENFIGVSWTLTYEVFFYCLFGSLMLFEPKIGRSIIIAWIISLFLNLFNLLPFPASELLNFSFNPRNLEFVFGCIAGYITSKFQYRQGTIWIYPAVAMLAVAMLNTKYHAFDVSGVSPVIAYGIPFSMLIIGSVQIEQNTTLKIPSILIYLGNASYAIYLTHGFFINNITKVYLKIAEKLDQRLLSLSVDSILYITITTAIVSISIAIGCIIHAWIERPLLKIFRKEQLPN